jgi:acyl-CoA synthetase (AMP-forming)/AMP-acid ligase II
VMRFCQERLARFKVPRFVRIVDGFPMTASGKIQKFKLREIHEAVLRDGPSRGFSTSVPTKVRPDRSEGG